MFVLERFFVAGVCDPPVNLRTHPTNVILKHGSQNLDTHAWRLEPGGLLTHADTHMKRQEGIPKNVDCVGSKDDVFGVCVSIAFRLLSN